MTFGKKTLNHRKIATIYKQQT